MAVRKVKKPKPKRYTLSLSDAEVRKLTAYAAECGIERPVALHRIVSLALKDYSSPRQATDKRQLGLFDSVQIDIFNNTSKVE